VVGLHAATTVQVDEILKQKKRPSNKCTVSNRNIGGRVVHWKLCPGKDFDAAWFITISVYTTRRTMALAMLGSGRNAIQRCVV